MRSNQMSSQNKKVHFIGICGAGMSAVAKLLIDYGWQVSGSDDGFYPPVSDYIQRHKINFKKGYSQDNIPKDAGLIIIGKHAGLIKEENEEVMAAFSSGAPVRSFPEILGELSKGKENIVVVGSFGKSTCAALIAWCLEYAGQNPGYFIGAIPTTPAESSKNGSGSVFVLEGDEYPSSNWDDSSKFLHYHPNHLLLTSLAHDHLNIFKTSEEYKAPFIKLLSMVPKDGLIAACADGEGIKKAISKCELDKWTVFYSVKSNTDWHVENIKLDDVSSFDIFNGDKFVTNVRTSLLGLHNIENILGAGTLLLSLKKITPKEFSEAIYLFKPINRRLDKKSETTSIPIYEGFGSSYAKARSSIDAINAHFPDKKLVVLFEPHSVGWRSRNALEWYDTVFEGVHHVLVYQPPKNSELALEDITGRIREAGYLSDGFENAQKGITLLEKNIDDNSVVLILSSGGLNGFIDIAVKWLEGNFPL